MKLKTKYITIFVLLMAILGCSSSDLKKGYYRITFIDDYFFNDFTLIEVESVNDYHYILSRKNLDSLKSKGNYKKLKKDDVVPLKLVRIDSMIVIKSHPQRGKSPITQYVCNEFIWKNDSVITPVYSSPNIQGPYFVR